MAAVGVDETLLTPVGLDGLARDRDLALLDVLRFDLGEAFAEAGRVATVASLDRVHALLGTRGAGAR